MSGPAIKDSAWVRKAFLVTKEQLMKVDQKGRFFSSAALKFVDTTPGGNVMINPPAQFTHTADVVPDPRHKYGKLRDEMVGLGTYYSEAIDDNAQVIHMRFGTPAFTSLTTFFTGFYSYEAGNLARNGRATSGFYWLGRAAGHIIPLLSWPLLAAHMVGYGIRLLADNPTTKYYTSKPTMPLYWTAVQTMVNQIAVNRGIIPRVFSSSHGDLEKDYQISEAQLEKMSRLLPDLMSKNGQINVYALANRANRMAIQYYEAAEKLAKMGTAKDFGEFVEQLYSERLREKDDADFSDYVTLWLKGSMGSVKETAADPLAVENESNTSKAAQNAAMTAEELKIDDIVNDPSWGKFLQQEWDDGAAFASFRVTATGQTGESFSSSVMESEISQKINNTSSSGRNSTFSFAGGNLGDGAIATMAGKLLTGVKDVIGGLADGVGMSGLATLMGGAFVDIPKHWENSVAQLPRMSYNIQLRSPYGNPFSQLINLYIPLCMLLAAALPKSTGRHSYTAPFLVELFDKGRAQSRLALIDSMQITRGVGNLGFNREGHALGIDVSFSLVDLSSVLHMPITQSFSIEKAASAVVGGVAGGIAGSALGPAGTVAGAATGAAMASGAFSDDNAFTDYMNVLAGMGLADQIYSLRKLQLKLTQQLAEFKSWTSPAQIASWVGGLPPSRLISAFWVGAVYR